ncbi:uncharacterized protein LOC112176736 [Rosa chinensis]|uniref:uncharacterized protein LOC112176736 n=1 Tax=Rosa chinensis TaxID=74649 RepID=UPI000D087C21|nr:uncharacterized protein LOC112176736 [Rosa chinensis]
MENYSYPDSRESSPRSREIDCDTPSWDDQPPSSAAAAATYKVKLMCSYGGKIQPRPHDNQLAYVGGDTKILAVDRSIKLSAFISKLSSLCETPDGAVCFKYQLPGEDLDALISVTNDEDLDHMMIEYDRLYRASAKPARLRLFLFPINPSAPASFGSNESKSERQWFVDALNSVQIQSPEGSSPTAPVSASSTNPDFLFGFDKGYAAAAAPVAKLPDSVTPPTVPDSLVKNTLAAGPELVSEPTLSQFEIQRQIQELHRMQIAAGHEPTIYQRKNEEVPNPRAYTADYYSQKLPENIAAPAPPGAAPVPMPAHMQFPTSYMPERHINTGSYQVAAAPGGGEQPVYLISTPAGVYQAPAHRPATGPVGQAYYGVPQRMVPEVYRDAQAYNTAVAAQQQQQQQQQQQAKVAAYSEGFTQVGYDNSGRQVYYTTAGGAVASSYQTVAPVPVAVDARQGGGGALNQIQDGAR